MFWFAVVLFTPCFPTWVISMVGFIVNNYKQDQLERAGNYVAAREMESDVYNAWRVMMVFFCLTLILGILIFATDPILPVL